MLTTTPLAIDSEIARGGEGVIYTVKDRPDLVAKIWRPEVAQHPDTIAKLRLMLAQPPAGASAMAWPIRQLYSRRKTVGFVMPYIDQERYRQLFAYFNPAMRRRTEAGAGPAVTPRLLMLIAANLARAIADLHQAGHLVGDLNEKNALAAPDGAVALVDCDSMQITDPETGHAYLCRTGRPEYTPPELQDRTYERNLRTPEHDRFGLAVLAYKLLMNGAHPYSSIPAQPGAEQPTQAEKIARQLFPFNEALRQGDIIRPSATQLAGWATLPYPLRELFHQAFDPEWTRTYPRPTATCWAERLGAELGLPPADRRQAASSSRQPVDQTPGPPCPSCGGRTRRVKRRGHDSFWGCVKYPECRGAADPQAPSCPICDTTMRRRQARQGPNAGKQFWGCPRYPDCIGTVDIPDPIATPTDKS